MPKEKITKTLGRGKDAPSVTVSVDLDAMLDGANDVVERALAKGQLRVNLQSVLAAAKWKSTTKTDADGKPNPDYGKVRASDADVQKAVDKYIPGVKRRAKSAGDKVKDLLSGLSPEEKAEAIREATQGLST